MIYLHLVCQHGMLNCRTKRIALKKRLCLQLQPEMLGCPRGVERHRRGTCTHTAILLSCSVLPGLFCGSRRSRAGLAPVCVHTLRLHWELFVCTLGDSSEPQLLELTRFSCWNTRSALVAFPGQHFLQNLPSLCSCSRVLAAL